MLMLLLLAAAAAAAAAAAGAAVPDREIKPCNVTYIIIVIYGFKFNNIMVGAIF